MPKKLKPIDKISFSISLEKGTFLELMTSLIMISPIMTSSVMAFLKNKKVRILQAMQNGAIRFDVINRARNYADDVIMTSW